MLEKPTSPFKIKTIIDNPFLPQHLRDRAKEVGVGQVFLELLRDANINFNIIGNTSAWEKPGQGTLMVGDHSNRIEGIMLLAFFAQLGRRDIHFTVKPYSNMSHLLAMFDREEENALTISMLPRNMAKERRATRLSTHMMKAIFKKDLLTEEEIKILNYEAISKSAKLLSNGEAVNIFPTGSSKSNAPWQRGIGEIVKLISEEDLNKILIVPYRIQSAELKAIFKSLLMRKVAAKPEQQFVTIKFGESTPISNLFPAENRISELTSIEITRVLESYFRTQS